MSHMAPLLENPAESSPQAVELEFVDFKTLFALGDKASTNISRRHMVFSSEFIRPKKVVERPSFFLLVISQSDKEWDVTEVCKQATFGGEHIPLFCALQAGLLLRAQRHGENGKLCTGGKRNFFLIRHPKKKNVVIWIALSFTGKSWEIDAGSYDPAIMTFPQGSRIFYQDPAV